MINTFLIIGISLFISLTLFILITYFHNKRMNDFNLVNGYSESTIRKDCLNCGSTLQFKYNNVYCSNCESKK